MSLFRIYILIKFFRFYTLFFFLLFPTLTLYGQKYVFVKNLSVDFLLSPDRVLKNGFPVEEELEEVIHESENYQIIGIGNRNPLLGWQIDSEIEDTYQEAYRIIVSKHKQNIDKDIGDLWDSNRVESNKSINIKYSGEKLKPNSIYYWKVKVWVNNDQESEFSDYQKFKTSKELKRHFTSKYFIEKKLIHLKKLEKLAIKKLY